MNVAFIPVRGGSKSIPLKNIKKICGKPLVYWAAKAACECKYIDKVYISTDSDEIWQTVENFSASQHLFEKLKVVNRSEESASDTASTEFAMLEFAGKYDFDNIVLIQATSPLLCSMDLDKGFEKYSEPCTDSVMSVVHQYRFNWEYDENGNIHPANYDVFHRPRRQEFDGYLVENGAFYITSKERLMESKNRVSGNIKAVEMDEDSFMEIDEPEDWEVIEALMQKRDSKKNKIIPKTGLFLTDVDGCLTDGGMYYSEKGDELKKFNTKDGMGFKLLREKGIKTGIVTSESVELNKRRAGKLKLDVVETGCTDKASAIKKIAEKYGVQLDNVVYIGDDINDLDAIKMVGFGCCPADAQKVIVENADYVTKAKGGEGIIREVANLLLLNL